MLCGPTSCAATAKVCANNNKLNVPNSREESTLFLIPILAQAREMVDTVTYATSPEQIIVVVCAVTHATRHYAFLSHRYRYDIDGRTRTRGRAIF